MGRKRSADKKSNLKPVYYFALLFFFIVTISLIFKTVDTFKKSKFDGSNRFTLALKNNNEVKFLTVSPKDNTLGVLNVKKVSKEEFENASIPRDAIAEKVTNSENPKSSLSWMLKNYRKIDTDLTIVDLIRLNLFARGVDDDSIKNTSIDNLSDSDLDKILQTFFIDPSIVDEKMTIQITNSSNIAGLGNELASYLSSLGANVILVNTSQSEELESKIYHKDTSYTLDKVSEILDIEPEVKDVNSISDITIIIGKDKERLFEK